MRDRCDRINKPILSEQQARDNSIKLQMAIHNGLTVKIKYFSYYDYKIAEVKLHKID